MRTKKQWMQKKEIETKGQNWENRGREENKAEKEDTKKIRQKLDWLKWGN